MTGLRVRKSCGWGCARCSTTPPLGKPSAPPKTPEPRPGTAPKPTRRQNQRPPPKSPRPEVSPPEALPARPHAGGLGLSRGRSQGAGGRAPYNPNQASAQDLGNSSRGNRTRRTRNSRDSRLSAATLRLHQPAQDYCRCTLASPYSAGHSLWSHGGVLIISNPNAYTSYV